MSCYSKTIFKDKETAEHFICPINGGILKNPVIDGCGHSYCTDCIEKLQDKKCVISGEIIKKKDLLKNSLVLTIIGDMEIYCHSKEEGCEWEGIVDQLDEHIDKDCEYKKISCVHEFCEFKVFRKDLEKHSEECQFKIVNCPNCSKEERINNLENHHQTCEQIEIDCINDCKKKIIRKKMHEHIEKNCVNTIVKCPFIGCLKNEKRKFIQDHLCSSNGYIYHQKILNTRVLEVEQKMNLICDFIETYQENFNDFNNISPLHSELKNNEFDSENSHHDVIINQELNKAIKVSKESNSFVCIKDSIIRGKIYKFKLRIRKEISIGISMLENLTKIGFTTSSNVFISNLFSINMLAVPNIEFLEIHFMLDEYNNKIILKNLMNNRTSNLITTDIDSSMYVICFLLTSETDYVEIIQ